VIAEPGDLSSDMSRVPTIEEAIGRRINRSVDARSNTQPRLVGIGSGSPAFAAVHESTLGVAGSALLQRTHAPGADCPCAVRHPVGRERVKRHAAQLEPVHGVRGSVRYFLEIVVGRGSPSPFPLM